MNPKPFSKLKQGERFKTAVIPTGITCAYAIFTKTSKDKARCDECHGRSFAPGREYTMAPNRLTYKV